MQVGRGALGQAKEFKALQALTEQLSAAQQRAEENGRAEAAAARAAMKALAQSVSMRLGDGDRMGHAITKEGLHLPCSAAADKHGQVMTEESKAQDETCDELDENALLAACTAWLPPAACSNNEGTLQPVTEQLAMHLGVERLSAWLPAAVTSSVAAEDGNRHMDVAALLASTSCWLPPTSLPSAPASANCTLLKADERFTSWLPPAASESTATVSAREDRHMNVTAFLASASSWLPPVSNENSSSVEVRFADVLG
jgi:hypothetical protein